jgi:hypothetical protein
MAELEYQYGLRSTYYSLVPASFDEPIIRQSHMGHEIGYHYEVMSRAKGDVKQAAGMFQNDVELLRGICDIRTACMHGSPISHNKNVDFWEFASLSDYGLVGEAYTDIKGDFKYYTDTGGKWNGKNNIRDKIVNCTMPSPHGTAGIITEVAARSKVYINCHPERWAKIRVEIPFYRLKDISVNIVKMSYRALRVDE